MNILLLESVHPVAVDALEAAGHTVTTAKGAMSEEELIARLPGVHVLGIRSKTRLSAAVFNHAPDLLSVGAFCIGTNQIALEAAMRRGVCVFNAPFSNTRSVAEMVIAEIIMLARRLGDSVTEMRSGIWNKVAAGCREVRGKTLGVIGYGHIGSQLGVLAEALGLRVVFFDIQAKLPMGNNQSLPTMEAVLQVADFVTLHVPETPQTMGMMGAAQMAQMKKGACLINASRGTVVDVPALAAALKSGHIGGAAIDVFPEEPASNTTTGFKTELQGLPNVVLTPHIGGSTLEAQEAIGREVSSTLIRYASTGASEGAVNFPEVELPQTPNTYRVINVHRNVPGVLRDVNRIVTEHGANIHAQVLSTNAELGYLVMDLDSPVHVAVCDAMKKLETTIRARVV